MNITKHQNFFQQLTYTKAFRFPLWLIKKIQHLNYDKNKIYTIKMRMGHKIKLSPTQNYLYHTLINRQYHDENIFLASKFIKSSSPVILDIGANIGLYTCAYAQHLKESSPTIYAIEAVENNFNLLCENIKINHFNNIHPLHIALGKENGFLEFLVPEDDTIGNYAGNNITSPDENLKKRMKTKKVSMTTLDDLAKKYNINRCDFMKVDIEGAEMLLFIGGYNFIKSNMPVIQFEFNTHWLNQQNLNFNSFYQFFKNFDYDFYLEEKNYFKKIETPESFEIKTNLVDLLIVPKKMN